MATSDQFIVFTLSEQRYALHLANVERVIHIVEMTPLSNAPEIVMGLINIQGRAIPVLNILKLFRLPEIEPRLSDRMIIAHTSARTVAIPANDVIGIAECEVQDVTLSDNLFPGIHYLEGVARLDDGILYICDLEKFLSPSESLWPAQQVLQQA